MSDDLRIPQGPPWKTLSDTLLGRYELFNLLRAVRRSPRSGREHAFLRLVAPDWVNVIAVTEDRRQVLVEQYRHGTDRYTVEIPGGCVDPGEEPDAAAARELEEETGFRARALHRLGVVEPNPAFLSNRCWTYLALGCRRDGVLRPDPSEEITVRLVPVPTFTELIDAGVITHSLVIAAHDHLQRALRSGQAWVAELTL